MAQKGKRKHIGGKGKETEPVLVTFCNFVRVLLDYGTSLYLLLVLAVMPFYNQDGYSHIGTDKATFFCKISVILGRILLPLAVIWLVMEAVRFCKVGKKEKRTGESSEKSGKSSAGIREVLLDLAGGRWTWTDTFAALYGLTVVLSYLLSPFRERALWGADRWYMGFWPQMFLVLIYFLVSRFWKSRKWMIYLMLMVSAVVFTLGYLDRFSVHLLQMNMRNPSFISTIGNINWYCGYVVSVLFAGVGLIWLGCGGTSTPGRSAKQSGKELAYHLWSFCKKLLPVFCSIIGFGTLITQGSDSGIVALAVVLLVLFCLSASDCDRMLSFWYIMLLLCGVCWVTLGIWKAAPDQMSYVGGGMKLLLSLWVLLPMTIVSVFCFWLVHGMRKKGNYKEKQMKYLTRGAAAVAVCGVTLVLALAAVNTLHPGSLGALSLNPLFTFSEDWGSSRGATWKAGWMCFWEQDPLHKFLGVGPDSMWEAISTQGSEELREMVKVQFSGLSLTNAHNEWLTILVDMGILGLVGFAGMMVTGIVSFLKEGQKNPVTCICGLCLLGYTVNNIFSFQQAMGVATIFVIFGMGRAFQIVHQTKKEEG